MSAGGERLQAAFALARNEQRAAILPYVMTGYPDLATSGVIARALIDGGADALEIGMPFSDPLADGPTIQRAATAALAAGASTNDAIELVAGLRADGIATPAILMGYFNPVLHMGLDEFLGRAARAGVDGLIVADVPFEEARELGARCAEYELALVPLVAPTSTSDRIAATAARSDGFVYCVSLTGITGARAALASGLGEFLGRVRAAVAPLPTVVGFGISSPDHVRQVSAHTDGVVFASALIDLIGRTDPADRAAAAREYVASMRSAASWSPVQL